MDKEQDIYELEEIGQVRRVNERDRKTACFDMKYTVLDKVPTWYNC